MICELVFVVLIDAVIGGFLGRILGGGVKNPGTVTLVGTLGGALGVIPFFVLQVALWGPLFKSWPKHPNEMGMGDFVSPIPNLVFWASVLTCGALTGTLASLLCLAVSRGDKQVRGDTEETPRELPH